jgi:Icc-related predicted phosphoesterase
MIVYGASDLHGELPNVPSDADALLLAGDICPDFGGYGRNRGSLDKHGTRQRDWMLSEWLTWARDQRGIPIVFTWGNHDFVGEKAWLVKDIVRALPAHMTLLKDSATIIGLPDRTLRVWGTPWVPGLPYWAFYGKPDALHHRADLIPYDLDVLMTHGPPKGYGDYIPGGTEKQISKYGNLHGMNVGDTSLNWAITRRRPKVTICGHIHEARGRYDLDGSPIVNCAAVDATYDLHPQPFTRLYELEG